MKIGIYAGIFKLYDENKTEIPCLIKVYGNKPFLKICCWFHNPLHNQHNMFDNADLDRVEFKKYLGDLM